MPQRRLLNAVTFRTLSLGSAVASLASGCLPPNAALEQDAGRPAQAGPDAAVPPPQVEATQTHSSTAPSGRASAAPSNVNPQPSVTTVPATSAASTASGATQPVSSSSASTTLAAAGAGGGGSDQESGGQGGLAGGSGEATAEATDDAPSPEADAAAPDDTEEPPTSSSSCDAAYLLCEDFENTSDGEIPEGWDQRGEPVSVESGEAHRGQRALRLGPADNGQRRIARSAEVLGDAHWARLYYKVELPVPEVFVHSTLVALSGEGPNNGPAEYRLFDTVKQASDTPDVGSRHNFLYNVQPENSGEFTYETNYDFNFDGEWHCAEYHIDANTQSYAFYWDSELLLELSAGEGNTQDYDIPSSFDELRVGWNNYQEAPPGFTVWIDDVAFDDERVGCLSDD